MLRPRLRHPFRSWSKSGLLHCNSGVLTWDNKRLNTPRTRFGRNATVTRKKGQPRPAHDRAVIKKVAPLAQGNSNLTWENRRLNRRRNRTGKNDTVAAKNSMVRGEYGEI